MHDSMWLTRLENYEALIYAACMGFSKFDHHAEIIDYINGEIPDLGRELTRWDVLKLLKAGRQKGLIKVQVPLEMALAKEVTDRFNMPKWVEDRIRVVRVPEKQKVHRERIAEAAADLIHELIQRFAARKEDKKIGLGVGPGVTSMLTCKRLGRMLRHETNIRELSIHALTSGFSESEVDTTPLTFFRFFEDLPFHVKFVGLFAEAFVQVKDYARIRKLPGVMESFEESANIDIAMVTVRAADDSNGLLRKFLTRYDPDGLDRLAKKDWQGEVQFLTYGEGHIPFDKGIRVVTLFEWADLVQLANDPNKAVVVLAPSTPETGAMRGKALKPLLEHELNERIWSYIITDDKTCQDLKELKMRK